MFRSLARRLGINPLDPQLKRCAKKGGRRILLGWNRGLGDIALGLYAIVHRIRKFIPDAEITFITRENLRDGFSMLEGVHVLISPDLRRGIPYDLRQCAKNLGLEYDSFDLILERPSPTDWCSWQRGTLTPKLKWDRSLDRLSEKFDLSPDYTYIGVQVSAETNYGLWRNWPLYRWEELFNQLEQMGSVRVLLFGYGNEPLFFHPNIIDLRGKTTLFELLAIIKRKCHGLVLPDSGISSMTYYLDDIFPLRFVSLWADAGHGILKQRVDSPNSQLVHIPLVGPGRDLSRVEANQVVEALFPKRKLHPLSHAVVAERLSGSTQERAAAVILAGGQGSRLGFSGPKGLFPIGSKSLFQRLCEKCPPSIPIAIMTSPENYSETVSYFAQNNHFGREVFFFEQSTLPLLDDRGNAVGEGADGNGSFFERFAASGLAKKFEERGIETLLVVPVDNPLADPADGKLVDYHRRQSNDVTIKCIERQMGESMGVLVEDEGKIKVAEYIDLTPKELLSSDFRYGYTGQVALSLQFVYRAAALSMPLHWVKKKGVWKREKFLFDAFSAARGVGALCYRRETCYAPVKGADSIKQASEVLSKAGVL